MSNEDALSDGQRSPKLGQEDLIRECLAYEWTTILDVGAGSGWVARHFLKAGRKPSTTFALIQTPEIPDFGPILIDRMESVPSTSLDAIWAAHVLEHSHNTGMALTEMHRVLRPGGWLFLSVPPFKHDVVGGHVNVGWNLGLLAYVLALHGFDARHGSFIRHGYNLSAFVRKTDIPSVELTHDQGDLERLSAYLPETFPIVQNTNGNVESINWTWRTEPELKEEKLVALARRHPRLRAFARLLGVGPLVKSVRDWQSRPLSTQAK